MIKGAIRALVILQITASWVKKKKATFRLALSLHPSICALSRKKCTWIIYAFRNISALRSFLGRHASKFIYTSLIHLWIKLLWHARKCLLIDQSLKHLGKYCDRFLLLMTVRVAINSIPFLCTTTETAFLRRNPWQKTSMSTRNILPGMKIFILSKFGATCFYFLSYFIDW